MENESTSKNLNAEIVAMLESCVGILGTKRQDYGDDNFIFAAHFVSNFCGIDIEPHHVAACLIGIKLARYKEIVLKFKNPVHEPIDDTIIDMINYIVLMERERRRENEKTT